MSDAEIIQELLKLSDDLDCSNATKGDAWVLREAAKRMAELTDTKIGASALKRQPDAPPPQTQCSADAPPLSEPKEGR